MAEDTQGTDTPTTAPINVPDKPALEGLEDALTRRWLDEGTYKFNPDTTREQVYSIDTPPPTASGSLHVGHMFSYTQTDVLARYQRMTGKNVFYPMGWDDNGLPTERRVQNYYGVRCDPAIPYDAGYRPPAEPAKNQRDFDVVSRRNFIELCEELAVEDEKVFENLFQTLGLSVDWDLTYRTIDDKSRAISQRAFLANLAAGDAYMAEAPTLWDVTFRTAVAQAELEDREVAGRLLPLPVLHRRRREDLHRDHPPGTAGRLRRPGGESRRRTVPAAVRQEGHLPPVRRRGGGQGPPARQGGQGLRHRHGLHLR